MGTTNSNLISLLLIFLREAQKVAQEKAAQEAEEYAQIVYEKSKSLKDHDPTGKYLHEDDCTLNNLLSFLKISHFSP